MPREPEPGGALRVGARNLQPWRHDTCWPCSPNRTTTTRLAEAPFVSLERCIECGALWEIHDRGARRTTVDFAQATFGVDVPVFSWAGKTKLGPVVALHARLNQGTQIVNLLLTSQTGCTRLDTGVPLSRRAALLG
jgi:hypothetical protein